MDEFVTIASVDVSDLSPIAQRLHRQLVGIALESADTLPLAA